MNKRFYFIEERDNRFYVYYTDGYPVKTLFDVKHSRDEAEQAIEEHKQNKHPTQWEPNK